LPADDADLTAARVVWFFHLSAQVSTSGLLF